MNVDHWIRRGVIDMAQAGNYYADDKRVDCVKNLRAVIKSIEQVANRVEQEANNEVPITDDP